MELKPYQKKVVEDLSSYLDYVEQYDNYSLAYEKYWEDRGFRVGGLESESLPVYQNIVEHCPHICAKVPTAGGKTFIACNALKAIFDKFPITKTKMVVWLVPSITILNQTIRNLSNPDHPYRQKIETHFNGRVEVLSKDELLQGTGFNPTSVKEQLTIAVLSFDTFRSRKKEDRKIYQENGNLAQFAEIHGKEIHVDGTDETSLMNILHKLNPVVIVDESHNATTDLSVDMLKNLNPCFILDLTATPRKNSNIISYVSAIELKKENMVKLPVIVYNNHDTTDVINNALQMQKSLEIKAKELEEQGGRYIRPIVLFQAQPKSKKEEAVTFEKIKKKLINIGIKEEEIAIKTATINEIKQRDLMSPECPIKYIITVNALKEGWDCPFAYILASLANKSSNIDVTQILGRVLRQPYANKSSADLLNISYVFTASKTFHDTLQNIVEGLNQAGFSKKSYRLDTEESIDHLEFVVAHDSVLEEADLGINDTNNEVSDELVIEEGRIKAPQNIKIDDNNLFEMQKIAIEQTKEFVDTVEKIDFTENSLFGTDIDTKKKRYKIKNEYRLEASNMQLPQFYKKVPRSDLFTEGEDEILLNKQAMLKGFNLLNQDTNITFDDIGSTLWKVDVKEGDYSPEFSKTKQSVRNALIKYIASLPEEKQVKTLVDMIFAEIRKINGLEDKDIKAYIKRVIESMSPEQITGIKENPYLYSSKIRDKLLSLMVEYTESQFSKELDSDKIYVKDSRSFHSHISPAKTMIGLTKSLYEEEDEGNKFEKRVINEIANCSNVLWWHRNLERHGNGFYINGFTNHYPDFIVYTKSGKVVLVETKGDYLDNTDSKRKLRLGKQWANKAGDKYKYFMVFDEAAIQNAQTFDEFMQIIKEI